MNMLQRNIEDLKVIQSGYPMNSRGHESLRMAIIILERAVELKEAVNPHWVAGEGAGSYSGTVSVEPGDATFSVEYK